MVATKLSLLTGLLAAGSVLVDASPVDKRAGCTITSLAEYVPLPLCLPRSILTSRRLFSLASSVTAAKACTASVLLLHLPPAQHSVRQLTTLLPPPLSITINSFTVPTKTMFDLTGLKANTVVTLAGDVTFAGGEFENGILFSIDVRRPRGRPPTVCR